MSRCHDHTKIQDCGDGYLVWHWVGCVFFTLQRKKISQVLFHKATGYGQILETG